MELVTLDGVIVISMAPRVAPRYMAWWIGVRLDPLNLDELDQGSDGDESLSLREEEVIMVENPIHDGPQPMEGLKVLAMVTPALSMM